MDTSSPVSSPSQTPLRVVLDTDTYNEVDDQFALAHLLLSPERVTLEAVYAAPFFNERSQSPGHGMELSYEEIGRILALVDTPRPPEVFRGSTEFLAGADRPQPSAAADDLVRRALATPEGETLHVVAIAAATNVASALLLEPRIAGRIRVVWLGGHAPYWPHTDEFNLKQDLHAARELFDTDVPLVLVPCLPVASHVTTTVAELEAHLAPRSPLGEFLTGRVRNYAGNKVGWSKHIWDIAASAWVINPKWGWMRPEPSPVLTDDKRWASPTPPGRRTIDVVQELYRDQIFADFFAKASNARLAAKA